MKKHAFVIITTLIAACLGVWLALYSPTASALDFSIGAETGHCKTSVYLEMCSEHRPIWRVYAEASHPFSKHLSLTGSIQHFSSFDGRADLSGDNANQSGVFDYVGAGLKWRF